MRWLLAAGGSEPKGSPCTNKTQALAKPEPFLCLDHAPAPLPPSQPRAAPRWWDPQRHPKSQPHLSAADSRSFVGNASSCSHSAQPGIPWRKIEECSWSHPWWLPAAGLSWHFSCEGITQNTSFGIYFLYLLLEQHWHSFFLCICNLPKCLCRGLWQIRGFLWGISRASLFMHLLWAQVTRSGLPAWLGEGSSFTQHCNWSGAGAHLRAQLGAKMGVKSALAYPPPST